MKDIAVGITLGLAISGVKELMNTNKGFDALRKLAKQTDAGVKGLNTTLASYRKNLVKINAAQREVSDAKGKLFNLGNLVMDGAIAVPFKSFVLFNIFISFIYYKILLFQYFLMHYYSFDFIIINFKKNS
jgi:hypothetical protein